MSTPGLRFELSERDPQGVDVLADVRRLVTDGGKLMLRVGYFEGTAPEEGSGPAEYMYYQEFGISVPESPWFRSALAAHRTKYADFLADGAARILAGKRTAEQILSELGLLVRGDLVRSITDYGLVDTGHARRVIAWEVVENVAR